MHFSTGQNNMYRSASWSRVSDDYYSPNTAAATGLRMASSNELPIYDPKVEMAAAKRERARDKFAENAVHLIPLVLFICAFILWFFSDPDAAAEMLMKSNSVMVEGRDGNGWDH